MARCDVDIELDREDPAYTPDETVTGRVVVEVHEDVECDALVLERIWEARALGDEKRSIEAVGTLFSGQWRAGQKLEYPFEVELPPGPYDYRGQELEVGWKLQARADVAGPAPRAEAAFELEPGGAGDYVVGDEDVLRDVRGKSESAISWEWVVIGALPLAAGTLLPAAGLMDGSLSVGGVAFFLGLDALGIGLIYKGTRSHFAEKRLGDVEVSVSPEAPRPGDEITCRVRLPEEDEGTLDGAEFELRGVEVAARRKRRTDHELHSETVALDEAEGLELGSGEPTELSVRLQVPESAPYSFYSRYSRVTWTVTVRLRVAWGADWVREKHVIVRPALTAT